MTRRKGRPTGSSPRPEVLDKERLVVDLRREGKTWQQIAEVIGYKSPSGAADAYARASARIVADNIESLRRLEADRLDALFSSVWDRALAGDYKALELALKVMDRRAKLLGLDQAPIKRLEPQPDYSRESIEAELAKLYYGRLAENGYLAIT